MSVPDEDPNCRTVTKLLQQKEEIEEKDIFSLWIVSPSLELRLRPKEFLNRATRRWKRWAEKYAHEDSVKFRFMFKRDALVWTEKEALITKISTLKLLYTEAKENVISGLYPCEFDDAVYLASLQLFIDASKNLGMLKENLGLFIPSVHLKEKRESVEERILEKYEELVGISSDEAIRMYLQVTRKWPIYGSVFFSACKIPPSQGNFKFRVDHFKIGVNLRGIHIIDLSKSKCIMSETFSNIAWLCSADSVIFEYGSMEDTKEITLITPQASLIDEICSKALEKINRL